MIAFLSSALHLPLSALGEPDLAIRLGMALLGVTLVTCAYLLGRMAHARHAWAHPLFTVTGGLMLLMSVLHLRYEDFQGGGDLIASLLGPATVALGVPMYRNARALRKHVAPLSISIFAGAVVGMITAGVTAWALGAPRQLVMTAVPKSVTTPIAMEVARQLHGIPEIAAAMAILAGLLGSMIGPALLRRMKVGHDLAIGAAMGTASHAIGTSRVLRDSDMQASSASLAMAFAGIATSLLAIPVAWLFC